MTKSSKTQTRYKYKTFDTSNTMQSKRYCFTLWLHNQDIIDEENIQSTFDGLIEYGVTFIIGQLELCPGTGRRHIQSYIEFKRAQRGTRIANVLGVPADSVHFQIANGSCDQNIAYCTKEASRLAGPYRMGEPSMGQGSRTDLLRATQVLREHGIKRVAEEHPTVFVKYHKGLSALQEALQPKPVYKQRQVRVFWGPTGTGKTRRAYQEQPDLYRVPAPTKGSYWFDGYSQESTVLIDDYGGTDGTYPITFMLQLLDGYPMKVPVKGGFVTWNPDIVYITSNIDPTIWYAGAPQAHIDALFRRFTLVEEITHFSDITILVPDD